jgi:hypothetical protein
MFIAKHFVSSMTGSVDEFKSTHTSTRGGFRESVVKELAVMP